MLQEFRLEGADWRTQSDALKALQEATEMYIVNLLEDSYLCAMHAKRVTLMATDMRLAKFLRKEK